MTFLYRIKEALNNATFTDVGNTRVFKTWQIETEENVANSWMNLYIEGKYEKAEGALIETLVRMERGDPDKLAIIHNMALIYAKQKKHTEAKDLLSLTLMKMQQQGHSQTQTLICKCNLASVYAILDNKDKAETLVLEVLACLQQPNSLKDPFVQKTTEIIEYLARQAKLSQSHPSTIGRIQPKVSIQFAFFPTLPPEIRNLVWGFTAAHSVMQTKMVTLVIQDNKIITAYTRTQSLPLVCKESYALYFQQYSCHNHDFIVLGEQNIPLAVNFAQDIFYLTGDVRNLNPLLMTELLRFQKVALQWDKETIPSLLHDLPQLQELWVLSRHDAERYLLSPGKYQQVWSAHHCDEFPDEYTSRVLKLEKKSPCPICFWAEDFNGVYEEDLVPTNRIVARWDRDIAPHEFVLTYSSELPVLPTHFEIPHSENPVLRWVRRTTSNLSDPSRELLGCDKWSHFHAFALEYFQRHNTSQRHITGYTDEIVQVLMDKTNSS